MTQAANVVAYHGLVELLHWEVSSNNGPRMKLGLAGREDLEHFDKATKRTKKRAGQRYMAVWQDTTGAEIANLPRELWFYGANWSHNAGASILFSIHEEEMAGLRASKTRDADEAGDRWYLGLVELDSDDKPVDQTARAVVEAMQQTVPTGGPVSKAAGILCGDAQFWRFLQGRSQQPVSDAATAAELVRKHCGIESRAWLDHDDEARAKFEALKGEFLRWGRRYGSGG